MRCDPVKEGTTQDPTSVISHSDAQSISKHVPQEAPTKKPQSVQGLVPLNPTESSLSASASRFVIS
jgi:hypothetical protein